MTIVGFNFAKIEAEKKELIKGKVNINNNVSITGVNEKNLALGDDKQKVLSLAFEFSSNYEPSAGAIKIGGDVLFMDNSKRIKGILDEWKKNKKLPKDIMLNILNTILNKCNIQALILSEQVNLPSPIPLPKVRAEQKQ